jgi:signal transduction histidine kinase
MPLGRFAAVERPTAGGAPAPLLAPTIAAVIVGAVTASLFAIWFLNPAAKEFSGSTMKANTALAMMLAAGAVGLANQRDSPRAVHWGRWLALGTMLIGGATMLEYLGDWHFGIDEWLVGDFLNEESRRYQGRMSPITAGCFCVLALSIWSVEARAERWPVHPTSALAMPLLLVALVVLSGYIYGVRDFYQLGPYIRISWVSAGCFLLLGLGCLMARPERGPLRYVANARLSGIASRRLLPAVIVLPLAFGWLCVWGQKTGFFGVEVATALFAVSLVVVLGTVVWIDARAVDAADREREKWQEHLAKALRLREEFLGIASHELKTPLTALLMQVQGVERAMSFDPTLERYYARLKRAAAAGLRLEKLINELLDVSRIAEGRLRLEPERFELAALIEEVVGRFGELSNPAEPKITVDLERGIHGRWDRLRLDQVLTNLLSNALKYGSDNPIEVTARRDANFAVIAVRDQGIGIPKEEQQRIFGRFERSVQARAYGGFGLGLWIAREIVVLSGGTISVESDEGAGACFSVRLPADD